jgi:flagellar motor switch protein FliM
MDKLLSQEEIDALLRGVENGEVETKTESVNQSGAVPYDFANQYRVIRGSMAVLDVINDRFSRLFRNSLSSALRKIVDVSSKGIQMLKYGEFIKILPVPSSLHIFKMDPLRGHALLVLESKLVFTLVDIFFGGSGKTVIQIEGREFTAIESKLIQRIVAMIFADLEKAWNASYPLTFQYIRSEINPQYVNILQPTDLTMTIPFEVVLEQFTGVITACIPYSTIEPIKTKLTFGYQSEHLDVDSSWTERFVDRLKTVNVELKVELGRSQITVQDLLQLKAGDTFYLGKEATDPLVVQVEGVPKFIGKAGAYGGNKAIQIDERIKNS